MRKEVFWVAGIGIVLGLFVAFGIYRINSSLKKTSNNQVAATPKPSNSEFKIVLNTPEDRDVVTQDSVTVSGLTKPQAIIAVSGEDEDYILQADAGGVFSQDVDLIAGVNQIKITAFDPKGNQSVQKVLVVYSSSFETNPAVEIPQDATGNAAIQAKVAQKVEAALNKPKAYLGTVTDIADSTIQIKSLDAQIQQISTSGDSIAVVNSTGTTAKTVKLTDVAIGDFIAAMGYIKENSVLSAQRILITKAVTEPKIDAAFGSVTATSKKDITVSGTVVTPDKNTAIMSFSTEKTSNIKLAAIETGDTVIYIMDGSTVRSIFVILNSQS